MLLVSCDTASESVSAVPTTSPAVSSSGTLFPSLTATQTKAVSPTPVQTQQPTQEPTAVSITPTTSPPASNTPIAMPEVLPGSIYRINLSSTGIEANDTSEGVSISEDGNKVAFVSFASNLVENDANDNCTSLSGDPRSCTDVFVKDLLTDEIMRVSVSNNGLPGNRDSGIIWEWGSHTSIASGEPYIVFHSDADNLVPGVASRSSYLFDMELNQIQLVSSGGASLETNVYSINPVISADGRFIVFQSNNPDLVENDTNGVDDIFLYDVQTKQVERISVGVGGEQANHASGLRYPATISNDGRFVAFVSEADNLVPNDNNNLPDVFLYDRNLQETIRISTNKVNDQLGESNGASTHPSISANGQFVVFQSDANNLIQNDMNDAVDIFLYHVATEHIELVSVSWEGGLAAGSSGNPDISSNGRWIAFSSEADNLVPYDTNNVTDVFIYDTDTGRTVRVSVNNEGQEGNHVSHSPAISADGSRIAFVSLASNLVPNDSNERWDIFVRDLDSVWD